MRELDHVNLLAVDPAENRIFASGIWPAVDGADRARQRHRGRGLADVEPEVVRGRLHARPDGTRGRLHHIAFLVDQREDVLRAADIFLEYGIVMESGPHKHAIQQTFFLYTWEPGGNRVEICSGGHLILAPDHEPVVWSQAERAKGQAWGMKTMPRSTSRGRRRCPRRTSYLPRRPLSPAPRARELVRGAYDLHVHVEPDLAKRRIDDLGLAHRFAELGLAGFVLKSHYVPTAERAAVVRAAVPGVDVLGAITLNAGVGGLNAHAVEIAARGARASSGSRRSTPRTRRARTGPSRPSSRSGARSRTSSSRPGSRAGRCGRRSAALAAGARGRRAARPRPRDRAPRPRRDPHGRRRRDRSRSRHVVVTHPDYPTQGVPVAEQRARRPRRDPRALLCADPPGKVTWEQTFDAIRATGPGAQRPLHRSRPGRRTRRSRTGSR